MCGQWAGGLHGTENGERQAPTLDFLEQQHFFSAACGNQTLDSSGFKADLPWQLLRELPHRWPQTGAASLVPPVLRLLAC